MTVLYASTVRPFDGATLRAVLADPEVVLVEPWLAGTSAPWSRTRCATSAPAAGAGRRPRGAAPLRHAGGARPRARARRGRDPTLAGRPSCGRRRERPTRAGRRALLAHPGPHDPAPRPLACGLAAAPGLGAAGVAQLVERSPCKRNVAGSTPVTGSALAPAPSPAPSPAPPPAARSGCCSVRLVAQREQHAAASRRRVADDELVDELAGGPQPEELRTSGMPVAGHRVEVPATGVLDQAGEPVQFGPEGHAHRRPAVDQSVGRDLADRDAELLDGPV